MNSAASYYFKALEFGVNMLSTKLAFMAMVLLFCGPAFSKVSYKKYFFDDGEIKSVIVRNDGRPQSKIRVKKLPSPSGKILREKSSYKYVAGWKCEQIVTYEVNPVSQPSERMHFGNVKLLTKKYCNKKGEVKVQDYFQAKKYGESEVYAREIYKDSVVTNRFELLFSGQTIVGFKELRNGTHYEYHIKEDTNFSSVSYLNPYDVKVMVIDSGLDFGHESFFQRVVVNNEEIPNNKIDDDGNGFVDDFYGLDLEYNDSYVEEKISKFEDIDLPLDEKKLSATDLFPNFHGTHVTGIVMDYSQSAKVFPVRGDYLTASFWGTIDKYLSVNKFDLINMSAGIKIVTQDPDFPRFSGLESVIERHPETLFVFPSGNDGLNIDTLDHYTKIVPAEYRAKNMLIVGAVDKQGNLTEFSNVGTFSVDVAALGKNVLAARPGGSRVEHSGTSMASPLAAAVASDIKARLLASDWGQHYRYSFEMSMLVKQIIMATVDIDLSRPFPVRSGGSINAQFALYLAQAVAQERYLPDENKVFEILMSIIGKEEFDKRMELWKSRGGLL